MALAERSVSNPGNLARDLVPSQEARVPHDTWPRRRARAFGPHNLFSKHVKTRAGGGGGGGWGWVGDVIETTPTGTQFGVTVNYLM